MQHSIADFEGLIDCLHAHMLMELVPPGLGLRPIIPHARWRNAYRTIVGYSDLYEIRPDEALFHFALECLQSYLGWLRCQV